MAFNSERRVITCCKDCPDRYPGCHGQCEKYKAERAVYDAQKKAFMEKYEVQSRLSQQTFDTIHKTRKHINYRKKFR